MTQKLPQIALRKHLLEGSKKKIGPMHYAHMIASAGGQDYTVGPLSTEMDHVNVSHCLWTDPLGFFLAFWDTVWRLLQMALAATCIQFIQPYFNWCSLVMLPTHDIFFSVLIYWEIYTFNYHIWLITVLKGLFQNKIKTVATQEVFNDPSSELMEY